MKTSILLIFIRTKNVAKSAQIFVHLLTRLTNFDSIEVKLLKYGKVFFLRISKKSYHLSLHQNLEEIEGLNEKNNCPSIANTNRSINNFFSQGLLKK